MTRLHRSPNRRGSRRRQFTTVFFLLPLIAVIILFAAPASPFVEAADGFEFELKSEDDREQVARPSQTVDYEFTLRNTGTDPITVQLTATSSPNVTTDFSAPGLGNDDRITLAASQTVAVVLNAFAPAESQLSGDKVEVDLTVRAIEVGDSTNSDTEALEMIVITTAAIDIALRNSSSQTVVPGGSATFNHTVEYLGTVDESVRVTASSQLGYDIMLRTSGAGGGSSSLTLNMSPDDEIAIEVIVNVPSSAPNGVNDTITVVAASTTDPTIADQQTDTLRVRAPQATATADEVIYVDQYEPNNDFQLATDIVPNGGELCGTFFPVGDFDIFRFFARRGLEYHIYTFDLELGIDTVLTAFNTTGQQIGRHDDISQTDLSSELFISATQNGYYYARVDNVGAGDVTDKLYCIEVIEQLPRTPTNTPTATSTSTATPTATPTSTATPTVTPEGDMCEPNENPATACVIAPGQTISGDFAHPYGALVDRDYYRFFARRGVEYTCVTSNLSALADTRLEMRNQRFEWLGDNDNRVPFDASSGSEVSVTAREDGTIYVIVLPFTAPERGRAAEYLYSLTCTATPPTLTPTPTNTLTPTIPPTPTETPRPAVPQPGGGVVVRPTSTPLPPPPTEIIAPEATATPFEQPTATPLPLPRVRPLSTPTPVITPPAQVILDVLLYYDINRNFVAEGDEGIMDVAVALYDNQTGELIAFGYTNEAGIVSFGPFEAGDTVRVSIPYLDFNQVLVSTTRTLRLRIPAQLLPGSIP